MATLTAGRRLRAVPTAHEELTIESLRAQLVAAQLEQARRAAYLRMVIAEHTEEKEQLVREYEQLADRFNAARAELHQWRSWAAIIPTKGQDRAGS